MQTKLDWWMSLREAFRARAQACSENGWVLETSDGYGPKPSDSLASLDHGSPFLKIHQPFFPSMTEEIGTPSSVEWPRSGMIVGGKLFALPSLVPGIYARDCASSAPTPRASPNENRQGKPTPSQEAHRHGMSLLATAMLPTPTTACGTTRGEPNIDQAEETGYGLNLSQKVKAMLPTPTTRDYKDTPGMNLQTEDRNRNDQLPRRVFSELLPTLTGARIGNDVTVLDATDQRTAANKLGQAIGRNLLPTPNAKPDQSSREAREAKGQKVSSTTQHAVESQICEAAPVTRSGGMRLTPEFLCWLQGYPPDWLKPLVAALGTASSRKRSSQSRGS